MYQNINPNHIKMMKPIIFKIFFKLSNVICICVLAIATKINLVSLVASFDTTKPATRRAPFGNPYQSFPWQR